MNYINREKLEHDLRDYSFGKNLYCFQSISSTNEYAKKLLESGKHRPAVIVAEKQTRGKGRMGRSWSSRSGKGVFMSVIFTFFEPKKNPFIINYISALAVQMTLKNELNLNSEIKWPNDILLKGRKVCGILSENVRENHEINHIISGIGLNVNQRPSDFPAEYRKKAISLKMAANREYDITEVIIQILKKLNNLYLQEKNNGTIPLFKKWLRECSTIGKEVEIRIKDEIIKGVAENINYDGVLSLRTPDHSLKKIIVGDLQYLVK